MSDSYQPFQISTTPRHSQSRTILTTVAVGVGAVLMAIFLNLFVFQSYFVDGESMAPTLHTNDRLIVSKVERSFANATAQQYVPRRGDIVVINGQVSPSTSSDAPELIKRVIGIPGDTVEIKNSRVTVANESESAFDIDQRLGLDVSPTYSLGDLSLRVPEGSVFVLGDNRSQGGSLDSRAFGLVGIDFIDGRLWARIMPFEDRRVF